MLRKTRGTTAARRTVLGAVALLVPVLAGCEAGLNAPTQEFHPASNGLHTTAADISVNNLFVLGGPGGSPIPAGGSAGVFLALSNSGTTADTLTGVSTPVAAHATLVHSVGLAPGASVLLTGPKPDVVLTGLTQPLTGGTTIQLTLTFAHYGNLTVKVPVEPHDFYYDTFSPPAASPTATATATPSATPTATGAASPSPTPSK